MKEHIPRQYRIKPAVINKQRVYVVQRKMRLAPFWYSIMETNYRGAMYTETFRTRDQAKERIDELLESAKLNHAHRLQAAEPYP